MPDPGNAGGDLGDLGLPAPIQGSTTQEASYPAFLHQLFGLTEPKSRAPSPAQTEARESLSSPVTADTAPHDAPPPGALTRIVPVPGDLLEFLVPAGYPLTLPTRVIGGARTTCRRPVAGVAYQTHAGRDERSCVMAATESTAGRALWLGFPLSALGEARETSRILQHALSGLIRWTAGRPLLLVEPWPAGPGQRVGLAIALENGPGGQCLKRMVRDRGLEATWFMRDGADRSSGHPPVAVPGEVGLLAPDNLLQASVAGTRRFLIEHAVTLRRGSTRSPLGVLIRSDQPLRGVVQDLAMAGFDYVLTYQDTKRRLPKWISTRPWPIIQLPAPVIDLAQPLDVPEHLGLSALERLEQAWPEDVGRPLSIVQLGSRGACEPHARDQLDAVLEELADHRRYHVAPLGELVAQWRYADKIETECRALANDRLFIRVTPAGAGRTEVAMDLFMAHTSRMDRVVAHRLRAPELRADCRRPFRCELTTRIPAGLRRIDFFGELRSSN